MVVSRRPGAMVPLAVASLLVLGQVVLPTARAAGPGLEWADPPAGSYTGTTNQGFAVEVECLDDPEGSAVYVDFKRGSTVLETDRDYAGTSPSYTFAYPGSGTFTLSAVCRDQGGSTAGQASWRVTWGSTPNTGPNIEWASPSAGSYTRVVGQAFPVEVECVDDAEGHTVYVDFYRGSTVLETDTDFSGTSPSYSYSFPSAGTYSLKAKCRDNQGASGSSSERAWTVTVSAPPNTGPNLEWASPAAGSYTRTVGQTFPVEVECVDDAEGNTVFVDFYKAGTVVETDTDYSGTSPSYSYSFSTAGTYSLKAKCRDNLGASGSSSERAWTVTVSAPPNTGPNLEWATPNSGSYTRTVGQTFPVEVECVDDAEGNTVYVDFSQGNSVVETDTDLAGTSPSYSYSFSSAGTYALKAKCRDSLGASGSASERTWTVTVSAPPNTGPNLEWASPNAGTYSRAAGQAFAVEVECVDDAEGNTVYVDFYRGNSVVETDTDLAGTSPSHSYSFSSAGTYALKAKCRDSLGASGSASERSWTVTVSAPSSTGPTTPPPNTGPNLEWASPNAGSHTRLVGQTFAVEVECVDDAEGNTVYVDFYQGGTVVETDTDFPGTSPSYSYSFASSGTYSLKAKCRDSLGASGPSGERTWTVTASAPSSTGPTTPPPNTGPDLDWATPDAGNHPRQPGQAFSVEAECLDDPEGHDVYVDFYLGAGIVGTVADLAGTSPSYSYSFPSVGTYSLKVKCRDSQGASGPSSDWSWTITVESTTNTGPNVEWATPDPGTFERSLQALFYVEVECMDDAEGHAVYVDFYHDGVLVGTDGDWAGSSPTFAYRFMSPGTRTLTATCRDEQGESGPSGERSWTVTVEAGQGQLQILGFHHWPPVPKAGDAVRFTMTLSNPTVWSVEIAPQITIFSTPESSVRLFAGLSHPPVPLGPTERQTVQMDWVVPAGVPAGDYWLQAIGMDWDSANLDRVGPPAMQILTIGGGSFIRVDDVGHGPMPHIHLEGATLDSFRQAVGGESYTLYELFAFLDAAGLRGGFDAQRLLEADRSMRRPLPAGSYYDVTLIPFPGDFWRVEDGNAIAALEAAEHEVVTIGVSAVAGRVPCVGSLISQVWQGARGDIEGSLQTGVFNLFESGEALFTVGAGCAKDGVFAVIGILLDAIEVLTYLDHDSLVADHLDRTGTGFFLLPPPVAVDLGLGVDEAFRVTADPVGPDGRPLTGARVAARLSSATEGIFLTETRPGHYEGQLRKPLVVIGGAYEVQGVALKPGSAVGFETLSVLLLPPPAAHDLTSIFALTTEESDRKVIQVSGLDNIRMTRSSLAEYRLQMTLESDRHEGQFVVLGLPHSFAMADVDGGLAIRVDEVEALQVRSQDDLLAKPGSAAFTIAKADGVWQMILWIPSWSAHEVLVMRDEPQPWSTSDVGSTESAFDSTTTSDGDTSSDASMGWAVPPPLAPPHEDRPNVIPAAGPAMLIVVVLALAVAYARRRLR